MRKGMDLGRGKGYRNVVLKDKVVHSLSAKGVSQSHPLPMPQIPLPPVNEVSQPIQTIPEDTEQPLDVTYEETIDKDQPIPLSEVPTQAIGQEQSMSTKEHPIPIPQIPVPEIEPQPQLQQKKESFLPKIFRQTKEYVHTKAEERRTLQEEMVKLSDNQIKILAVRTPSPLFGKNVYEKEYLRRIEAKSRISKGIVETKQKLKEKKGTDTGLNLGFLNPFEGVKK